ncbi:MAG TPA: hypothetical protein VHQ94_05030 [Pyrinomonadaceae bacterium]|jgi:hypothetical protein|nr:hypothetical protein [Pyrinomonadaceae bacterium]
MLDQLDELKTAFGPQAARKTQALLETLSRQKFRDTDSLVRYHELLLFVRAYPHNAAVLRAAESELNRFAERVAWLREHDVDVSSLEHPEISGIAGTPVTDTFSFYIVRSLMRRYPAQTSIYWDWFEDENRLAATWPRFMPLLAEDASVEAHVPYREWLDAARGRRPELAWLIERFDDLPATDEAKAELYDSQNLYVQWRAPFRASRTGLRVPARQLFYHREPLIHRRDINLDDEVVQPSPPLRKLSLREGERALDRARDASTIRYRELYGFTHGDPKHVYHAELGRGVELFLIGLPPNKRLPLRAYHAAMIYKNGVPIGYFEGLTLFERMESGFNLYYTFRDGETAWLYARVLNVMHHFTGATAFSLDPYQIGHENEEGIESGAFWFYRKLGFRPMSSELVALAEQEEKKIATRKGYRTPPRTLRELAKGPMIFQLRGTENNDWNDFQIRNIGFKAQGQLEPVLSLFPDRIRRAKTATEETTYLRQMQKDKRLRKEILKHGSQ